MEPSPHLTWAELACRDGTAYPAQWRQTRAVPLAREFDAIRTFCGGRPLVVLSAFRTPSHNTRVGGAKASQHLQGRALDLKPPKGMTVPRFHELILAWATVWSHESRIRGIGLYPEQGFVHIDIRPSDWLVRWNGGAAKRRIGDLTGTKV